MTQPSSVRPLQVNGTALRWARDRNDTERIAELERERDWLLCLHHIPRVLREHGAELTTEQRVELAATVLNPAASAAA